MMLRVAAMVCVVLLLVARPARAHAAPNRLLDLRQTVEKRPTSGLTKAQAKTLAKIDKILGKTPTNTAAEVTTAIAVEKLLDKAFPGDAQFGSDLDAAIPDIEGDVTADHDALAALLAALPDGKNKTKAQTALAAAETSDAGVATAGDRQAKLDLLKSAVASIGKGFNAVTAHQSYVLYTLDAGGGPRRIATTKVRLGAYREPLGENYQIYVVGLQSPLVGVKLGLYPVSGPRPVVLGNPGERFTGSAAAWYGETGAYLTSAANPGVATITRFDDSNSFDVTFSFTGKDPDTGVTVTITDGVARIR
jgi:hypothetical protein